MKRIASFVTMLVLALAGVAPLLAADAAQPIQLKGWITDSYCGAKNANKEGAACAKECHKNGAALELVAEGKTYKLSDQKSALDHVGHEVVVTGTIDKDTIKVAKIEAAAPDKKTA
jgi:Protein of unknown function (DUF5818)